MAVPNPTPLAPMTPPALGGPSTPPVSVNPLPIAQRPRLAAPTGRPADANPSQVSAAPPQANSAAPAPTPVPSIPLAAGNGPAYANANTNTPGGAFDYLTKTLVPAAGVDRLALAKSNWDNFAKSSEPDYKAAIRDTDTAAAGAGQIGSGMLRTRHGDLALARSRDLDSAKTSFLNDATAGSIDDSYRNIGIAQQQQGFQSGQQNDAFNQFLQQQQLEEMLRSGSFGRSATTLAMGNSGNPSDVALALSGIYGSQAGQAGASASDLLKNSYLRRALDQVPQPAPTSPGSTNIPSNQPYWLGTM